MAMRLYLDVHGCLTWDVLSHSLLSLDLPKNSATGDARAGEILQKIRGFGTRFHDAALLERCVDMVKEGGLTVGPIPLDLKYDEAPLTTLRGFAVRSKSGVTIDGEAAAFLAGASVSAESFAGTVAWIRDERAQDGTLLFRWIALEAPSFLNGAAVVLSTNIDDMTPESLGYVIDCLLSEGARDVWIAPIIMKKSRPAFTLHVLASLEKEHVLLEKLFHETTTLGVRRSTVDTYMLERRNRTVATPYGVISVKESWLHGSIRSAHPEHEDCARFAKLHTVPLSRVYDSAMAAWHTVVQADQVKGNEGGNGC